MYLNGIRESSNNNRVLKMSSSDFLSIGERVRNQLNWNQKPTVFIYRTIYI